MILTHRALALSTLLLLSGAVAAAPADEPEIQQLQTVDQLADAFNRDEGATRVVLLLSPT